jgi:hypothetical protein
MIKLYDAQFFRGSSTRSEGAGVFTRPRPGAVIPVAIFLNPALAGFYLPLLIANAALARRLQYQKSAEANDALEKASADRSQTPRNERNQYMSGDRDE